MPEVITNNWFDAVFPTPVEVTEEPTDVAYAKTTDFSSEVEPFGLYCVRVTQMPIDPFIAVGPRQWVKTYGDHWPAKFAEFKPQVMRDEETTPLGGATRELDVRLDYQGPCSAFVRLSAHPLDAGCSLTGLPPHTSHRSTQSSLPSGGPAVCVQVPAKRCTQPTQGDGQVVWFVSSHEW